MFGYFYFIHGILFIHFVHLNLNFTLKKSSVLIRVSLKTYGTSRLCFSVTLGELR